MKHIFIILGTVFCLSFWSCKLQKVKPNVIFILADDLGYGDVNILNEDSKIPTPNMDRIGKEGMIFKDAHSGSGVCTPTRYGLITGRYSWRTHLKRGVLNGYSQHLIDPNRTTVADVMKNSGYKTGCVGKWHLGMDFPLQENSEKSKFKIDISKRIQNSPTEYGFDYFFGISASLDFPPYIFLENDHFVGKNIDSLSFSPFPVFARTGEREENFKLEDCLDIIADKARNFIQENSNNPFFLYVPLTAPHKPVLPHKRFEGNTNLGPYGDFITQVDWTVGSILKKLDELDLSKNTLVVLSSDNGSFMNRIGDDTRFPPESVDHVEDETIQAYDPKNHRSNYKFRGTKADIWEGGHHVPFLVRWPKVIEPNSIESNPICLTDFFETMADLTEYPIIKKVYGEDSFSFLPLLKQNGNYTREGVIHHSSSGMFAIRKGKWKLILGDGSGGRQIPRGKPFGKPYQLFDLSSDIEERNDLSRTQSEELENLLADFKEIYGRTENMEVFE